MASYKACNIWKSYSRHNLFISGDFDVMGITDWPVDPVQHLGVEILWNPFDDIVPR